MGYVQGMDDDGRRGKIAEMEVQVPLQNSEGKIIADMCEVMGWGDSVGI